MRDARDGPGIFSNSLVNIAGLVTVSLLGAIGGIVTARYLGRTGVGILAVTWAFVEFGRAVTSCTHVPSILWSHKGREDGVVFGTSLFVKVALSAAFIALMWLLAPLIGAAFELPPIALVLASTTLLITSALEVGLARMESKNRMVRNNVMLAFGSIVTLASVVTLALLGQLTVITSILTIIVSNGATAIGALAFMLRGARLRVERTLGVEMTKYGARIVAAALLTQGLLWTDTLMVSYLLGNASAGVYQVVFLLTFIMVSAATAMGTALVPALSGLVGRGEDTAMGYQRGSMIALAISLGVAALYVVGGPWILALYGDAFVAGYRALLVLTLFGVSAALAVPAATMLTVHGRAGLLTRVSLAQLAVNVPLNFALISSIGILGAAIATTSVFVLGTGASWWLVHRTTGAWPFSRAALAEGLALARAPLSRWRRD